MIKNMFLSKGIFKGNSHIFTVSVWNRSCHSANLQSLRDFWKVEIRIVLQNLTDGINEFIILVC